MDAATVNLGLQLVVAATVAGALGGIGVLLVLGFLRDVAAWSGVIDRIPKGPEQAPDRGMGQRPMADLSRATCPTASGGECPARRAGHASGASVPGGDAGRRGKHGAGPRPAAPASPARIRAWKTPCRRHPRPASWALAVAGLEESRAFRRTRHRCPCTSLRCSSWALAVMGLEESMAFRRTQHRAPILSRLPVALPTPCLWAIEVLAVRSHVVRVRPRWSVNRPRHCVADAVSHCRSGDVVGGDEEGYGRDQVDA